MQLIDNRALCLSVRETCDALSFPRSSYCRSKKPLKAKTYKSHRKLNPDERQKVLDILRSDEYMDLSPAQVYNHLLDKGEYVASERTMYRILNENKEVRERRQLTKHPIYKKPELLATGPNQLWSWDITRLRGPNKLEYYHLYVMLDVYSRYVVGWMLAHRESAELAKELVSECYKSQNISPEVLTVHSDRGPAMKAQTLAELFDYLKVTKSHSRPQVSNDNPYSEAQFKTTKYSRTYPDRFGSIEDAKSFCRDFFAWYNQEHYHSGIAMLTPKSVHYGQDRGIISKRNQALSEAFKKNKHRFVNGKPKAKKVPAKVWINKPINKQENQEVITC